MSYEVFASEGTDRDEEDLQTLYASYKRTCEPLFLSADNVATMSRLTSAKLMDANDEETLDAILRDIQECRTARLLYHQARGGRVDASHEHLLNVLHKFWRYGNAKKKSMSKPMVRLFIERAMVQFGSQLEKRIRHVAILVSEAHDDVCTMYGVDPRTTDDRELQYVAESLVIAFLSVDTSEGRDPVTPSKFMDIWNSRT